MGYGSQMRVSCSLMAILHVVTYSTYKSSFDHNYIEKKNNDNAHPPNNEKFKIIQPNFL